MLQPPCPGEPSEERIASSSSSSSPSRLSLSFFCLVTSGVTLYKSTRPAILFLAHATSRKLLPLPASAAAAPVGEEDQRDTAGRGRDGDGSRRRRRSGGRGGGDEGAAGGRLPRRPPGGAAPAQQRLLRRLLPRSATAALTSVLALISYPCDSFARSLARTANSNHSSSASQL